MSIEGHSNQPEASIHVNHYCCVEGCGRWGGFGFSENRGEPQWWCWEHYPHKPNQAQSDAIEIADALRP